MTSFELDIVDEKSRAGTEFVARVVNELRRALATEKTARKLTQQAIAEKIGTSRAVINRQVQGLENLSARRIGELFWAIGWEPFFEARKIPITENLFYEAKQLRPAQTTSATTKSDLVDDGSLVKYKAKIISLPSGMAA